MQHYSLEDWADFARNVAGDARKLAMHSHLETGCKHCTKLYTLWQRVDVAARRESTFQPPEAVVRTVKGLGAIHGIAKPRNASSKLAELLFDSFRSPLLAGIRSTAAAARQLLYGAGDYRIDVRMEPQMDSEKVAVVGQVLNAVDPSKQSPSFPVILLKGKKIVSVSQTNSFGEFNLECELVEDLKLHLKVPTQMDVWIPLVNPTVEISQKTSESKGVKRFIRKVRKSTKGKV
jgi:hypothetical protein